MGDSSKVQRSVAAAAAAAVLLCLPSAAGAAQKLYVSERGNDAWSGKRTKPLRTVTAALARASDGARVMVAAGSYPAIRDSRRRHRTVHVIGYDSDRRARIPAIAGAGLHGSSRLSFSRLRLTGPVKVTNHPTLGRRQRPHHIVIDRSELTSAVPYAFDCVTVSPGAANITVRRSRLHACRMGISGPGDGLTDPRRRIRTRRIDILDNVIENMSADGIVFAHWRDSTIRGNVIRHIHDVTQRGYHNDAIQVMGDGIRLRIERNHLADSGGQLLFVQDAIRRQSVRDSVIAGNLIHHSAAYAVQLIGTRNVRFVNNTVWFSRYGGVLVREGQTRSYDSGAVIANNLLPDLAVTDGVRIDVADHNLMPSTRSNRRLRGPHDIVMTTAPFVDADGGDFRLAPGAAARHAGAPALTTGLDLLGTPWGDTPSIGALQARG